MTDLTIANCAKALVEAWKDLDDAYENEATTQEMDLICDEISALKRDLIRAVNVKEEDVF